ncbi:MAG: amidase [Alphaproteobacteria bacterium]|jgi:aspartyl-tRNA(Asn)/glutamyl-tRNA(Gln) amidotransferase subunit A|nr:Asp-tRNA(Asn)/Glu-tRNA(Gln) amidotransferase GatCAB subunit A [Rhodospirillaceae bacterium]MDP6020539.1 amidase [Alphaproteobacteria bacterium]MDP6257178.1 amidase [Alphaproteobacteria bacterium]MDP7052640.1 amidase [Alphaproteobacteria bacterium]MDP7229757.1 amidase [Alphaproteobacteria bacterium]
MSKQGQDLPFLSLTEVAALIRAGELSSVAYTQGLLDHIAAHDGQFDSFLRVLSDSVLTEAEAADNAVKTEQALGPLHGVPFGLKDIVDVAGLPTTAHSQILAQQPPKTEDATVTTQLRAAGGILLGKTATHEFAIGGPSFDLPWPPARNPWNRDHSPGGSSSGSGAAVAAGFVPMAIGTDTGGSVRNPATSCGIVGMKATYGRVSRRGVVPLSYSLDHVGPMTRNVADNALMLNVLAGHDPDDPASADVPTVDYTAQLDRGVKGLRIGVIRHFHNRDLIADPTMAEALEEALRVLQGLGAEVVEIETTPLAEFATCNRVILLSETYAIHRRWLAERPGDYGELFLERVLPGAFLGGSDYVDALRLRRKLTTGFNRSIKDFDGVIAISSMDPAFAIEDPDENALKYPRQARTPFNLTGNPALAMPNGFDDDGLPLAMQIIGRNFDEATIYRIAAAYEGATEWHKRRPPL